MELTSKHNGIWYDPSRSGQGFSITVLENGFSASMFWGARVPHWFPDYPTYFTIQGHPGATLAYPLAQAHNITMGEPSPLTQNVVICGDVHFSESDDGKLVAVVTVSANGKPQFSPPHPAVVEEYELIRIL